MLSPLQLVKRTPVSNCGQCGQPTCLAYAAAVIKVGLNPSACPFIDLVDLNLEGLNKASENVQQEKKDLEFIRHLKAKIAPLNFAKSAPGLGANFTDNPQPALLLNYLGQDVVISKDNIIIDGIEPEDHRDKILLYNYVSSGGGRNLSNDWLGLESLPNSISKIKTLATYCEDRLAQIFEPDQPKIFKNLIGKIGGQIVQNNSATFTAIIPILPMLPQYILFWQAEPEDNFPAKVKVLFDRFVMDFLDIESLVFSAERLADRITFCLDKSS